MKPVVLANKTIKCMSIRDFTQQIGKVLLQGGEVVVYKGNDPYRYMNIRPIVVSRGGISEFEYQERLKESQVVNIEKQLEEEQ